MSLPDSFLQNDSFFVPESLAVNQTDLFLYSLTFTDGLSEKSFNLNLKN